MNDLSLPTEVSEKLMNIAIASGESEIEYGYYSP
jgi:hypothetical protein